MSQKNLLSIGDGDRAGEALKISKFPYIYMIPDMKLATTPATKTKATIQIDLSPSSEGVRTNPSGFVRFSDSTFFSEFCIPQYFRSWDFSNFKN